MSILQREVRDNMVYYDFLCEGCEAEGTLGVPRNHSGTIGCPEGCGATYLQWKNLDGEYELTCVVCPVFEDVAEGIAKRQARHAGAVGAEGAD